MSTASPVDTVLLIHGTCTRPLGWEHWVKRYSARKYSVIASTVPVATNYESCLDWYRDPHGRASAVAVADYYERILRSVPVPPILIGHCLGGMVVQLLLERKLGAAGVAISAPPAPGRKPSRVVPDTPPAEPFVDYRSSRRAPFLLVAGGLDTSVPTELVAAAAQQYQKSDAITGYLEYPDVCHHSLRGPCWEQLADDVLDWAELHTDPGVLSRVQYP